VRIFRTQRVKNGNRARKNFAGVYPRTNLYDGWADKFRTEAGLQKDFKFTGYMQIGDGVYTAGSGYCADGYRDNSGDGSADVRFGGICTA
jgi:hypothetical protein